MCILFKLDQNSINTPFKNVIRSTQIENKCFKISLPLKLNYKSTSTLSKLFGIKFPLVEMNNLTKICLIYFMNKCKIMKKKNNIKD